MQIKIIGVGKIRENFLIDGIKEYLKRLTAYAKVQVLEVADEKAPENLSPAEGEQVKLKEAQKINKYIDQGDYVIALAIGGKAFGSADLAKHIEELGVKGKSSIAFVIGGSLGLHEIINNRADLLLSFSRFTFPHQLMRLILLEQVYRSFKIIKGEPYHK